MISVQEAQYIIENLTFTQTVVTKSLSQSLDFVLAQDIISPIHMPPFAQSAMDGYALKFGDGLNFDIIAEIQAGSDLHPTLNAGEATRIFTGAAVPKSADAVIMQEKTIRNEQHLTIEELPKTSANIRPKGEQIKAGDIALKAHTRLTPAAIGFLAGLGIDKVKVYQKPRIGIAVTGNELVAAGTVLQRGQIYESNGIMLQTVLQDAGFEVQQIEHVKDDYATTLAQLSKQIDSCDFVLISGGISVGDYDFVGKALLELGTKQLFYKIRQKPGKPIFLGQKEHCTIFALPGNPASALSCFYLYVLKALKRASGDHSFQLKTLTIPMEETYHKKGNRANFLKAKLTPNGVKVLHGQSSAMLHSFAEADALVFIPETQMTTPQGSLVTAYLLP